jgi:hypothetical protein
MYSCGKINATLAFPSRASRLRVKKSLSGFLHFLISGEVFSFVARGFWHNDEKQTGGAVIWR